MSNSSKNFNFEHGLKIIVNVQTEDDLDEVTSLLIRNAYTNNEVLDTRYLNSESMRTWSSCLKILQVQAEMNKINIKEENR